MSLTLQQVLDALAGETGAEGLAEQLAAASAENLSALETEALEAFDALRASDSITDDDLASLEAIASAVETVRGETGRRETASAERAERIAEIAGRVTPAGDAPTVETDEVEEAVEDEEREPVTVASVRPVRVDVAAIARRTQRPTPPEQSGTRQFGDVFRAAADVPGFANGHGFANFQEFATAFGLRAAGRPSTKAGVARIRKGFTPAQTIPDSAHDITRYLAEAADLNNLTAAGWCSPSEMWYDICPSTISRNGLFSLPERNAPRGGVNYTKGFDLAAISASVTGFGFTETEMLANPTKPCLLIPCPEFEDEVRLGVEGICIATDIPFDSTYPEAVAAFLERAMSLHARKVSGDRLAAVVAGSTSHGTVGSTTEGATAAFFNAIELQAVNYRSAHLADWDAPVEVILPTWIRGVLRSDIIKRNGLASGDNAINFADSVVNQGLALRNAVPQWVNTALPGDANAAGWQTPASFAVSGGPTAWPDTVLVVMYFPGSWVALTKDVIDVSTIYDSVGLSQNRYTQLFMESGIAVINRCNESIKFTIPLCPDGTTASQVDIACAVA